MWLLKSEPDTWSWDDQVKKGIECWNGVRNYQARNYLKSMKIGDHCFFYHSNVGKEIVGIVQVVKEAYPDPDDVRFVCIDVKTLTSFNKPVSLKDIKNSPLLTEIPLIKQSRLSVMPISQTEWDTILGISNS